MNTIEIFGLCTGTLSIALLIKQNIWTWPVGIAYTFASLYIFLTAKLYADFALHIFFLVMSFYGWYYWSRKKDEVFINNVSRLEKKEYLQLIYLALGSLIFIYFVYVQFDKWNSWTAYVDNITTAIFFVAMWLMARRKIESWIFWIVGNIISVPLYLHKGLAFTSIQYFIFTVIAIAGYIKWKELYNKQIQTA